MQMYNNLANVPPPGVNTSTATAQNISANTTTTNSSATPTPTNPLSTANSYQLNALNNQAAAALVNDQQQLNNNNNKFNQNARNLIDTSNTATAAQLNLVQTLNAVQQQQQHPMNLMPNLNNFPFFFPSNFLLKFFSFPEQY
jgi:hypothetical protein